MNSRILCICQKGNCRSVATRFSLIQLGYRNVIAIGAKNTHSDTLKMLTGWSNIILLAALRFSEDVPEEYQSKIDTRFFLGTDIWKNAQHPELQTMIKSKLIRLGYGTNR